MSYHQVVSIYNFSIPKFKEKKQKIRHYDSDDIRNSAVE
jgi:hypothetical protein